MYMLIDWHVFEHRASVPWPNLNQAQLDWVAGIDTIESWLKDRVGGHYRVWAWSDSGDPGRIGVAFRWDQDRSLFVLAWA